MTFQATCPPKNAAVIWGGEVFAPFLQHRQKSGDDGEVGKVGPSITAGTWRLPPRYSDLTYWRATANLQRRPGAVRQEPNAALQRFNQSLNLLEHPSVRRRCDQFLQVRDLWAHFVTSSKKGGGSLGRGVRFASVERVREQCRPPLVRF